METEKCWFCEENAPDPTATISVKIQGDELGRKKAGFKEYTVSYAGGTVGVPRCLRCKDIHESTKRWGLGCTLSFIIPVGVGLILQQAFNPNPVPGASVTPVLVYIGIATGILLSIVLGKKFKDYLGDNVTKPEGKKNEYPPIKELVDGGYKIIP